MYKKVNVVMLPTNQESWYNNIVTSPRYPNMIQKFGSFENSYPDECKVQHLYITSDEEMKKGDCVYIACSEVNVYEIRQITEYYNGQVLFDDKSQIDMDYCKKIIATTDTSLISINEQYFDVNKSRKIAVLEQKTLPQPSQEFIRQYIEEYNKGNVIEFVDVEYTYDNGGIFVPMNTLYLLVNSDNTINIKPIKDSWSKEDVVALLYKSRFHKDSSDEKFDKWIEQNI